MSSGGAGPAPERGRQQIEDELREAVAVATAELHAATQPSERRAAVERLRTAVRKLTQFTLGPANEGTR